MLVSLSLVLLCTAVSLRIDSTPPLIAAIKSNSLSAVTSLLANASPAELSLTTLSGAGPLHAAVFQCKNAKKDIACDILRILVRSTKLDADAVNLSGQTAIMMAVRMDHQDALQILLDAHVDSHIPDSSGNTPLHAAVMMNSLPMVRQLVLADTSVYSKNANGHYPVDLARSQGLEEIAGYLEHSGNSVRSRVKRRMEAKSDDSALSEYEEKHQYDYKEEKEAKLMPKDGGISPKLQSTSNFLSTHKFPTKANGGYR